MVSPAVDALIARRRGSVFFFFGGDDGGGGFGLDGSSGTVAGEAGRS